MFVLDARYFFDGFGIEVELGDLVGFEGSTETARIVRVDYDASALELDRALNLSRGQGAAFEYRGSAPELGALEREE